MTLTEAAKRVGALFEAGGGLERRPPRYPGVAVSIQADRVAGVRVQHDRAQGRATLRVFEHQPLPAGAVEPSLTKANILAPEPVQAALRAVLARVSAGEHRVSVVIPDDVVRVALVTFATLPRTRRELVELVRFRMAKSLPFKVEDAVTDVTVLSTHGAAQGAATATVLALFAHRAVVEQYEGLLRACGLWPGLVSVATLEIHNLFRPRLEGHAVAGKDVLLLLITASFTSLLIFRGHDLIFYRCKPHAAGGAQDGLQEIRREIYTSLAFYQEKLLGHGIVHAYVYAAGLPADAVRDTVAAEVPCPLEFLELTDVLTCAAGVRMEAADAASLAPAVGAVLGRQA